MKKLLLLTLACGGFIALPACENERERSPAVHSTTTTTEESTVRRPASSSTETQTVRTY